MRCLRFRSSVASLILFVMVIAGAASSSLAQTDSAKRTGKTDEPTGPQLYKSRNFHVVTDLSADESRELLERLETMLGLVSAYWGRRNTRPIEMYVARNLDSWPAQVLSTMNASGIQSIRSGGGVTHSQTMYRGTAFVAKSVVYAKADHGTPQHEAVHAYCAHAFGRTGPVWYSEGMAEVGQYWRKGEKSVSVPDYVITHLKGGEPKSLNEIVNNPLETTGDSWENYAWRWALCHLLGFNENYTKRFKPLGLALLAGKDVNFWQVYGSQAPEIEFEYRQFLQDLEPGYRVDLCTWDWSSKFKEPRGRLTLVSKIRADRGWQPARLRAKADGQYDYSADGQWSKGPPSEGEKANGVNADGNDEGQGRLIGVLFDEYQLSEPFELGKHGTFTAPSDGDLYVRCQDGWGSLADNTGTITLKFRPSDPDNPLPVPE